MGITIAVANQKGGIGKTTTTLCIADAMKYCGFKTLIVDMDPQCNTTSEYVEDTSDIGTIFDIYNDVSINTKDVILETERGAVIPGDKDLPKIESQVDRMFERYVVLRNALEQVKDDYDFILIDTPPTLGLWMINAIVASDGCICPIAAEKFAIDGLGQLLKTIRDAKKNCNQNLQIYGVLLNNYNQTKKLHRDIWATLPEIGEREGFRVFSRPIRTCQEISKAQAFGQSIFETAPGCNAANDFANILEELLKIIFGDKEGK